MAEREWKQPDQISVGASVRMISLEGVAREFGCSVEQATQMMDTLGLPRVTYPSGSKKYINLYALESLLFPLGLPEQFKNGPNNRNGTSDLNLIRLHQELAGVCYMASTKDAVRTRVKKLAQEMVRLEKPLTKKKKPAIMQQVEKVYETIPKGGASVRG